MPCQETLLKRVEDQPCQSIIMLVLKTTFSEKRFCFFNNPKARLFCKWRDALLILQKHSTKLVAQVPIKFDLFESG